MSEDGGDVAKELISYFKLNGFILETDACNFLVPQLPVAKKERDKWIEMLIRQMQIMKIPSPFIGQFHVEYAIKDFDETCPAEKKGSFCVTNSYDISRCIYNSKVKKYEKVKQVRQLLNEASTRIKCMKDRYQILYEKTIRNEYFFEVAINKFDYLKKDKLSLIENLLSSSSSNAKEVIVLGLLTQFAEGKFLLQDPTGSLQLNLTKTKYHSGIICEGCFVIVRGKYQENIIHAYDIELPPAESAEKSWCTFDVKHENEFLKNHERLSIEKSNTKDTIVFLSDVRLDIPSLMERLKRLFIVYNSCPPVAIVIMGPFCKPHESSVDKIRHLFKNLGELVINCDELKRKTDLILIPSSEDIGSPNILPRSTIPENIVEELKERWNRIKLATNPCRLNYCTQEIFVCKADLITKFCRNCIHFPKSGDIGNHFVQTIISQNHMAPIDSNILPVYWAHDTCLWLYPLPDLIVIGDHSDSFHITQSGCSVLNTGSFLRSKWEFKVYVPTTRTVEDSSCFQ